MKVLEEIKSSKGAEKRRIMKREETPLLKKILKYAYDPFMRYGIKKISATGTGKRKLGVDSYFFDLLDKLKSRVFTGNRAVREINLFFKTINPESAELFKQVLNKDLRIGIGVKTIEKVWPGLLENAVGRKSKIPVMLCKSFDPAKVRYPCFVSVKKDGLRARFAYGKLYTRQGKIIHGMDHILKELAEFPWELDGELLIPGQKFDDVSGQIRSHNPTPDAIYYVFDMPNYPGCKESRVNKLYDLTWSLNFTQPITQNLVLNESELFKHHQSFIENGEEGSIVCNIKGRYEAKRSWNWMKLVPVLSEDLPAVAFFEGTGKNKGKLGGIVVEFKSVRVRIGTGFSDKQREEIWNNSEDYLGKIAEIEYKEVSKFGALRQPRFKCWRWDK